MILSVTGFRSTSEEASYVIATNTNPAILTQVANGSFKDTVS